MTDSSEFTLLHLTGMNMPPYSARGLTQTLEPIDAALNLDRTINGELDDNSFPQFRKYKTTITGKDQEPPALEGVWPGMIIFVDCISELCFVTADGEALRPVVAGSQRTEDAFTFYRPHLEMRVTGFSTSTDEWNADVAWTLTAEEI